LISFRDFGDVELPNSLRIRIFQRIRLDPEDPRKGITAEYSYSYGVGDDLNRDWLLRYDYVPEEAADPEYRYPVGHVDFNGASRAYDAFRVPGKRPLHKLHFPTGQITLEDFIEHLIVELRTPARGGERVALEVLVRSRERPW
jgi:hypothetical protein